MYQGETMGTYDVGQLRLSDQILGLRSHQLLLQRHQSHVLGLPHLDPLDLVLDLLSIVAARLHALLGIADGLEDVPGIVEVVCIEVLLLAQLAEQDADLVGEVGDGVVVGLLAPLGELRGDGDALFARGLVGADQTVLGLDEPVETLGELRLADAAEAGEAEAMSAGGLRGALLLLAAGADGECSIPGGDVSPRCMHSSGELRCEADALTES
jgi:hypothetical protein